MRPAARADVFEATVRAAFPSARHADVLAALLLYRLLYNLVPFGIACIALGYGWLIDRPAHMENGHGAARH